MSKRFTLGKNERLKSRKSIEQLFAEGKKFGVAPFRVLHMITGSAGKSSLSMGTGVSAKHFKRAVDRNRIKRLTRESWRLQKNALQEKLLAKNLQLNVFLIYTGKELPEYEEVYKQTGLVLNKLIRLIEA